MDEHYQFLGRLAAMLLAGCLASYFLVRGVNAASRSLRLANLALACGLLAFVTLMDTGPAGGEVFVGHCIVWCPERQAIVEVIVEGMHTMASETGRALEKETFEKAAEFICLSVE